MWGKKTNCALQTSCGELHHGTNMHQTSKIHSFQPWQIHTEHTSLSLSLSCQPQRCWSRSSSRPQTLSLHYYIIHIIPLPFVIPKQIHIKMNTDVRMCSIWNDILKSLPFNAAPYMYNVRVFLVPLLNYIGGGRLRGKKNISLLVPGRNPLCSGLHVVGVGAVGGGGWIERRAVCGGGGWKCREDCERDTGVSQPDLQQFQ